MHKAILLRAAFFTLVAFSIYIIYYTKIVNDDFYIFTNPEGPDTTDYFLIEESDETYEGDT